MRCPTCGAEVPAAPTCAACGAPLAAAPVATGSLRWQVVGGNAFAAARVELAAGQAVRAESGAMISMSGNVDLQSELQGGLMGALKRMVTRESLFVSTFTAMGGPAEVLLAPPVPGDVVGVELAGRALLVQSSSWLGSDPDVQLDTEFAGFRGLFAGEGLFFIRMSGRGTALLSSYGAIVRRPLPPGARYVVDTGHIVAFDAAMPYQVRKASRRGWVRSILSGEALVAEFAGPGEVWLQTRNLRSLAGALFPLFPSQQGRQGGLGLGDLLGD
ncbi:TIGR00266 family protein [Anaeromyxobacter oryzae]|uniref:TIGR00266 family protein n=1 Tax=Anaeromyxobacter oryzae TaxID=2918170 RepID=A0ABM7WQD3_9BACT|nr:TIGR00266 family protein [Anaeromyxobacter oryzae]BDG01673.1 TIGR00266 family protein [Anaeromyxobacter oryzae]